MAQMPAHRIALGFRHHRNWGTSSLRIFSIGLSLAGAGLVASGLVAIASSKARSANIAIAHEIPENAPAASFETYLDRLMAAESGGSSTAKNPRSTALGAFQFIKSTFLEITRRHFPTEVAGLSEQQILHLRTDRDFSRRAAAAFSRDNLRYLKERGHDPTFAQLRLAFLLGPTDAAQILRARQDTPIVRVLSAPVVKANPFMRRMSVADLLAKGVRDISRERTLEVASEPQVGPISQVRPTDSVEAHQPTAARLESCNHKLASCRRPTALEDKAKKRASRVNGGKA
jgi:hypothetical protein